MYTYMQDFNTVTKTRRILEADSLELPGGSTVVNYHMKVYKDALGPRVMSSSSQLKTVKDALGLKLVGSTL